MGPEQEALVGTVTGQAQRRGFLQNEKLVRNLCSTKGAFDFSGEELT